MTKTEIAASAVTLAAYVRKCRTDEELVELFTAQLDLMHCAGKIAGSEEISDRLRRDAEAKAAWEDSPEGRWSAMSSS